MTIPRGSYCSRIGLLPNEDLNMQAGNFPFFHSCLSTIFLSFLLFSSPEPKAHGELIVYQSRRRLSVRASVNTFKHEYLRIYLNHHLGGGKAASVFWPDQIGTLVSMATDSSHRFIMGKILLAL